MAKKKIIFGPWIGELGWELTSWQGWVRKLCQEKYKDYDKYIISVPGRNCLYGEIENLQYLSHPQWFVNLNYSARAFATDFWTVDGPSIKGIKYSGPIMKTKADDLVRYFQSELSACSKDFIIPWVRREYEGQVMGGVYSKSFIPSLIPYSSQSIVAVKPTEKHLAFLHSVMHQQGFDAMSKLICFYPRGRIRNSKKNWPEKYYLKLTRTVHKEYPNLVVAFVGSPTGTLFWDKVPDGVLDLIHIPIDEMLNIHVAAMSQSIVGVGPASGMLHLAAHAQSPFICSLAREQYKKLHKRFSVVHNPFNCRMHLIKDDLPTLEELRVAIRGFLNVG